jgi:predicted transposase YdaD
MSGLLACDVEAARELVARTKKEIEDEALRADLIELIETVIIYKLPRLSREEIQAMLQVDDIRETRVYQEAVEEGVEKERKRAIAKLAASKLSAEDIARFLDLDIGFVRLQMGNAASEH